MRSLIILNTDKFQITSYGQGVAYQFVNKRTCRDILFQGDDALLFHAELVDMWDGHLPYDRFLARVWDEFAHLSEPLRGSSEFKWDLSTRPRDLEAAYV